MNVRFSGQKESLESLAFAYAAARAAVTEEAHIRRNVNILQTLFPQQAISPNTISNPSQLYEHLDGFTTQAAADETFQQILKNPNEAAKTTIGQATQSTFEDFVKGAMQQTEASLIGQIIATLIRSLKKKVPNTNPLEDYLIKLKREIEEPTSH